MLIYLDSKTAESVIGTQHQTEKGVILLTYLLTYLLTFHLIVYIVVFNKNQIHNYEKKILK